MLGLPVDRVHRERREPQVGVRIDDEAAERVRSGAERSSFDPSRAAQVEPGLEVVLQQHLARGRRGCNRCHQRG
jgi:hypothetical protein